MIGREIIYTVVKKYLDDESNARLWYEMGIKKYSDAKFIQLLEKHFDFSRLINSPMEAEDAWIYNYLFYELKRKDNSNPLKVGEKIEFKGRLVMKGMLLKYYNFMIKGTSTKIYFK